MANSQSNKNVGSFSVNGNNNNLRYGERTESDTIHPRFRPDFNVVYDVESVINKEAMCLNCKDIFLIKEQNDIDVHYLNKLHDFSNVNCLYCNLYVMQYQVDCKTFNYHSCNRTRNLRSKK